MPTPCCAERYPYGMPPEEAVRIIRAVAEALDYSHEQQFLHRDVKPSNILLSHPEEPTERIFLADFGIARWVDDPSRLTATNMAVGTVAYAAPEQLMGEHMDGRADEYALAATAFHLLTGTPVFQHSNPAVVISQHLNTPPPSIGTRRPDLRDLGPVFSKALAKAPEDRYDTLWNSPTRLPGSWESWLLRPARLRTPRSPFPCRDPGIKRGHREHLKNLR